MKQVFAAKVPVVEGEDSPHPTRTSAEFVRRLRTSGMLPRMPEPGPFARLEMNEQPMIGWFPRVHDYWGKILAGGSGREYGYA